MSDLISRQVAIELIHSLYPSAPIMPMNRKRWEKKYKPYIEAEKALEMLPSAQRKGKWTQIRPAGIYECSECGQNLMTDDIDCYHYCHHCGARMVSEDD